MYYSKIASYLVFCLRYDKLKTTIMKKKLSLLDLQKAILDVYGVPDDQLYTIDDLLYYGQKFALMAIKNLESENKGKAAENLIISFAWFLALMNRYHFDLEKIVWRRYSFKCPFCLEIPCNCQEKEGEKAKKTGRPSSRKPKTIRDWQKMVAKIYPDEKIKELLMIFLRKNDDLSYSFRLFLREKQMKYFKEIENKSADYFILFLRVFNSLNIDLNNSFLKMFEKGCHVCHKIPCQCNYIVL